MKMRWTVVLVTFLAPQVWAASRIVTLSIPLMNCPTCPITVKKALSKVPGVSQVEVNFRNRQATVVFDDAKTGVDALTDATANAGYPSSSVHLEK
tara:strand:- start:459 stop:743 length:285 start_codon:yes stop_codon:yes gene_type:complete